MGENIAFGTSGGYLASPDKGAGPALIVIQERGGDYEHGREVCDRFAAEGFTALAPELSNGHTAADLVDAIDVLKPHPSVRGNGVGVVGFAMGAGLALWLAAHRPDDVAAVSAFYGAVPNGVEQPDWSRLSAAVQGHYGEDDPFCTPETVSALEQALGEAGVTVEMFVYPTAGQAFFNETRPDAHVEDAARQAWIRTLEFLRKHLG
jgi:carboxymethylenebutenolidase